jgi:hypothetical protein
MKNIKKLTTFIAGAALLTSFFSCNNEDQSLSSIEKGSLKISWPVDRSVTYAYESPLNDDNLVLTLVSDGNGKTVLKDVSMNWAAGGVVWDVAGFAADGDASATATLYSYLNGTGLTPAGSVTGGNLTLTSASGNFEGLIASATTTSIDVTGDVVTPALTYKQAKLYLDPESNATAVTVSTTVANTVNVITGAASGSIALTGYNLLSSDLLVAAQPSVVLTFNATINELSYTGSKTVSLAAGTKYKVKLTPASTPGELIIGITVSAWETGADINSAVDLVSTTPAALLNTSSLFRTTQFDGNTIGIVGDGTEEVVLTFDNAISASDVTSVSGSVEDNVVKFNLTPSETVTTKTVTIDGVSYTIYYIAHTATEYKVYGGFYNNDLVFIKEFNNSYDLTGAVNNNTAAQTQANMAAWTGNDYSGIRTTIESYEGDGFLAPTRSTAASLWVPDNLPLNWHGIVLGSVGHWYNNLNGSAVARVDRTSYYVKDATAHSNYCFKGASSYVGDTSAANYHGIILFNIIDL